MTVPGVLPYIGIVPDIGGGVVLPGTDVEFLSPDRVLAYLQRLAPPGIWEVIGDDYPCTLPGSPGEFFLTVTEYEFEAAASVYSLTPTSTGLSAEIDYDTSSATPVLLFTWRTDPGAAGAMLYPGTWTFAFYSVSLGGFTGGSFRVAVVKENDGGATGLFTADGPINPGVTVITSDQDAFPLEPGDRIRIEVYVYTDGAHRAHGEFKWGPDDPSEIQMPGRVFTNPADDAAPWTYIDGQSVLDYAPQAADLLGIIITDVKGLGSTLSRNVTPRAIDLEGGTVEKEHFGPREIKVTGIAVATSSMGIEWAERWLARVLTAPLCDSCREDAYSFRQCCPSDEDPTLGYWAIYNAGLLEGPTFIPLDTVNAEQGDLTRQSCYLAHVEFTIGSEDPFLYKPMIEVAGQPIPPADPSYCYTVDPNFSYLGVDGFVVDFNDATAGSLAWVDGLGNTVTLFSFSIAGAARIVWDGARHRILVFDTDGSLLNPISYTDTGGLPLDWPQVDSECSQFAPAQLCPTVADGGGATIYRRHKEFG